MTIIKNFTIGVSMLLSAAFFIACSEEIDKSNRYTFTNETLADYLENRPEEFSSITAIYKKAGMMGTLETYGASTLFAPTNAAVERYLFKQDSIYWASLNDDNENEFTETGIHSPYLEDLLAAENDSMVKVIAMTHLVPAQYRIADMNTGALATRNYGNRLIQVNNKSDDNGANVVLENQATIIRADELVENGCVQVIDNVINQSSDNISRYLGIYDYFSIFQEAMNMIHFDDLVLEHEDKSYELGNTPARGYDGTEGTARYPFFKRNEYTIFAPTNAKLAELGIENIPQLVTYAEKFYGEQAKGDYTNPENALYKFVTYHILDMSVSYDKIIIHKLKQPNFNSELAFLTNMDRYDYFTTMQGTLIKVVRPLSETKDAKRKNNIFINPTKKATPVNMEMTPHLDVKIYNPDEFLLLSEEYADFNPAPLNGLIHPIDGVLIYDEDEMAGNVLNERMRFDFASLLPELTTCGVRFISKEDAESKHGGAGDILIPDGFSKNLKIHNDDTEVHYMGPYYWGCNLWGDEFIATNQYDFSYRLPNVPAGTYEIRIGYTPFGPKRAITQFYMNNKICGIPVDLRIRASEPGIGWERDDLTDDNGVENDKAMRNRGYMKAPHYFTLYAASAAPEDTPHHDDKISARDYDGAVRYIITTTQLSGSDNWIRMKKVDDIADKEGMHDFLEIVPTSIVNSIEGEDRY